MARSKRQREVTLSRVTKSPSSVSEAKTALVNEVSSSLAAYPRVYVFSLDNERNALLKTLRTSLKHDSRVFLGRTKLLKLALSSHPSQTLPQLAELLRGQVGLLFSSRPHAKLARYLRDVALPDFARSGFCATRRVALTQAGVDAREWDAGMEPRLRQLGVPVAVEKGAVRLLVEGEWEVCGEGEVLTPEKAKMLELMGERMAVFSVQLQGAWHKDKDKVELYNEEMR